MPKSVNQEYAVRRAVSGSSCMVSTGHHLATLAGLEILRRGGNAVDAAIAAGAVACVVLPHACGLGGDCFAIGYDAKRIHTWALNASGKSPLLASLSDFRGGIPEEGVAAATVPGIIHGWAALLERYGTRSLRQVLSPAIRHAEEGFVVNDILEKLILDNSGKLEKHPYSAKVFFAADQPLHKGQILKQPLLAKTLKRIAERGAAAFYSGSTAMEMCSYVENAGGFLRAADLSKHKSRWGNGGIGIPYHGYQVLVPPPNSLAILLLVQLKLLSDLDLTRMSHNSAEYIDHLVSAKRLAFKGVLPMLGDPDHVRMAPSEILAAPFIAQLRGKRSPRFSFDKQETVDTTCVVAVDQAGNCVSLIQSLFFHFGCGAIAGETGVLLNNRMTGFSLNPAEPNVLAGGKRPAHTLSPALVLKNNRPYLAIATPGAYGQTQTLCQVLNNILLFNMEPQVALEMPRWFDELDEVLLCEGRIQKGVVESLQGRGYKVHSGGPWEPKTGSIQCVLIDEGNERVLYGAADPRRHGCALGW
jgi:gamma-glutamyltranspeptidase